MKKSVLILFCITPMLSYAKLQAVSFPMTYADISFTERMKNEAEGYKPFMDKQAYMELNIVEGEEIYTDSMIAKAEAQTDQTVATTRSDIQETTAAYSGSTLGGGPVIENNIVTGGSCYPPAKDNHFTNKILTTGKYEHISPAFEKALITIFRKEGGCGTVKNDPCGYTCYGIGSASSCSGVVVKSRAEAEDFYYTRYWQKYNLNTIPDVISTDIMIASMASGPKTAFQQLRKFLGLPRNSTPVVDDEIIQAIKNYNGDIHNRWIDQRDTFLQDIARKRYNGSVSKGYKNAIEIKRKNGCHVRPSEIITR